MASVFFSGRGRWLPRFSAFWLRSKYPWFVASTSASILDVGTVLESVLLLICAGFVDCHCTGRWAVFDNMLRKGGGAFHCRTPLTSLCSDNTQYLLSGTDSKAATPSKIEDDVLATHQTLRCLPIGWDAIFSPVIFLLFSWRRLDDRLGPPGA